MNQQGSPPVRIFLFKREFTDAFDLRRALGRSFRRSLINVLDANDDGLRTACAVVRSVPQSSGLVLVEQERRDARSTRHLGRVRELLELRSFPRIVLRHESGDPRARLRAYEDGADGFVPIPANGADLSRVAATVLELWEHLQFAKSA